MSWMSRYLQIMSMTGSGINVKGFGGGHANERLTKYVERSIKKQIKKQTGTEVLTLFSEILRRESDMRITRSRRSDVDLRCSPPHGSGYINDRQMTSNLAYLMNEECTILL